MNTNLPLYNPPHPGEFITQIYLAPSGVSVRELAKKLRVSASTLSRLLAASHRVSPEMALRLSKVLGRSPESWLAMQDSYDLWQARARINVDELEPLTLTG
ncbi:MAG: addiction module HigA family antidote [Pontimonas sp.]|jgi:addiction module HigA family antidote